MDPNAFAASNVGPCSTGSWLAPSHPAQTGTTPMRISKAHSIVV